MSSTVLFFCCLVICWVSSVNKSNKIAHLLNDILFGVFQILLFGLFRLVPILPFVFVFTLFGAVLELFRSY